MVPDHRVFVFDFEAFSVELKQTLFRALQLDRPGQLEHFIERNTSRIHDPVEGESVGSRWRDYLGESDVQEFADFAMTAFYTPSRFGGLRTRYEAARQRFLDQGGDEAAWDAAMLGETVGPPDRPFDPGRMGTYLRAPELVKASVEFLRELGDPEVESTLATFEQADEAGLGALVTF